MASPSLLLPVLLALTAAPEPSPRSGEACSICGSTPVLGPLEAMLNAEPAQRVPILNALGATGSPLARPAVRASLRSPLAEVRAAAISALAQLGPLESRAELLAGLEDPADQVMEAAARALGLLPLPQVRTRLAALAADPGRALSLRQAALEGLYLHRTRAAWQDAERIRAADLALFEATAARRAELEAPCLTCEEPAVSQAISALLASVAAPDRIEAVGALGALRPWARSLALLDQVATRDPAPLVRIAALDRIATSTVPAAFGLLVHGLADSELEVRQRTVEQVASSTRSEGVPTLIALSRSAPFEDVRVSSTQALVSKPDPAALARLETVLRAPEPELARVVLLKLSGASTVAAELVDAAMPLAADPGTEDGLRSLALTLVASRRHPQAPGLLLALAEGAAPGPSSHARGLLAQHYPLLFAEYERNLPAPEAKVGFLLSSGAFGATTFSLLGRIRDDSGTATLLSAAGGFALGAGSAYLLGGNDDLYGGPVGMYATAGSWGLLSGLAVPMVLGGEAWPSYSRNLGGAIGTTVGTVLGAFALHDRSWSVGDALLVNTSGVEASLGTLGVLLIPGRGGDPLQAGGLVLLGGVALGTIPSAFFARSIELDAEAAGRTAALATGGGWLGLWGSRIVTGSERASQSFGGVLFGQSLGYLSGLILTQSLTLKESPLDLFLASAAGAAVGSGTALLATHQSVRVDATLVELGTLLGAWATLRALDTQTDATTVALGAALGAWLGGFAPASYGDLSRDSMGEEVFGGLLLGGTAGALLSAIALESPGLSPAQQGLAAVGSLSGAALGSGAMLLVPTASDRNVVQLLLAGTVLGAVGGTLGLSRLPIESGDATAAGVAAGYGALSGLLLGDLLSADEPSGRVRAGGALLLSSGFGVATLLASDVLELDAVDAFEAGGYGAAGAWLGHGVAGLVGAKQQANAALVLGAGTLALGAGLGLADQTHYDAERAAHLLVPTLLGSSLGLGLPYVLRTEPSDRERVAGFELMSGLGLGAGILSAQLLDRPAADALETGTFSLAGGAMGLGLGLLLPNSTPRTRASLHLAGTLSLGLATFAAAPFTDLDPLESSLVAVTAAQASFAGLFLPYFWHSQEAPPGLEALGGLLLGAGFGTVSGAVLTEVFELRPADADMVVELSFAGVGANLAGGGLGLLVSEDNRITVAFLESVGLLGTVAWAALAPATQFSEGDTALEFLGTSQALFNGIALASLAHAEGRQQAGATLLALGGGGLAVAGLAQVVEPTVPDAFLAFTGSVWGAWLGYFGARLIEQAGTEVSGDAILATTLVASDVGLGLTAFALSPAWAVAPEKLGWVNVAGLGGGVAGATLGLVAGGKSGVNPGNVIGCAAGLLGGAIVTAFLPSEAPAPEPASVPLPPSTEPGAPKSDASTSTGKGAEWTALLPDLREVQVGSLLLPPRHEGDPPPLGIGVSGRLF